MGNAQCEENVRSQQEKFQREKEERLMKAMGGQPEITKQVHPTAPKLTGGQVSYYLAAVPYPRREDQPPYTSECEDIIDALKMTFDEACIFKALWRSAAARLGNGKPGHKAVYDAEKMVHYSGHVLRTAQRETKDGDISSN